jgi:hypothetical protein
MAFLSSIRMTEAPIVQNYNSKFVVEAYCTQGPPTNWLEHCGPHWPQFVWGHYFVIPTSTPPPYIHGWEPPWPHGGPLLEAPWEPTILFVLHCNPMKHPLPWTKFDGGEALNFLVSCHQT